MKLHNLNIKKELPILLISILPLVYLALIWKDLPDIVPTHWNINGKIDRTGPKETLILFSTLIGLGSYITLTLAPYTKRTVWINTMGDKYTNFKFALIALLSTLNLFIIHSVKVTKVESTFLLLIIGAMFTILGNFMPILKANYFVGIRIPSTLKSKENWKHTHRFASKLWIIGGITTIILALIIEDKFNIYLLLATSITLCVLPIIYSIRFQSKNRFNQP